MKPYYLIFCSSADKILEIVDIFTPFLGEQLKQQLVQAAVHSSVQHCHYKRYNNKCSTKINPN